MADGLPSIPDTLEQFSTEMSADLRRRLTEALIHREDHMADMFRMAGIQFGLYPQIVAEVFAEVGIGTPVPEPQRQLVRQQFLALMTELQQQYRDGGQG